jgi:multicomponent Na+:H+ antiporter subunit A
MLVGFVLLGQQAGTYRISELLEVAPSGTVVTVALALVALGAVTKSAQYPFHAWLPGAMTASTPVSAYLHSATMVTAGVFLVARLSPTFGDVSFWRPTLVGLGLVTMVIGGLRALRQQDLKLLLAHGTVSQLGFMMVLFGLGTEDTRAAGIELVLAHALFKAALFCVVGVLDHQTGTRERDELPALGAGWGPLKAVAVANAASMAGLPLLFGFIAKEEALAGLEEGGGTLDLVALVGVVVGSILTVAYSARFVTPLFRRPAGGDAGGGGVPAPGALLLAPVVALTAVTILLGVAPGLGDGLLDAAVQSLAPGSEAVHLGLWHGLNLPLALTTLIVAGGLLLHRARPRLGSLLAVGSAVPSGGDVYVGTLRAINRLADRVTAVVQSGSLPIYTGVILATTAVLTGGALLTGTFRPPWPEVVARPGHVPIAVALVVSAVAAASSRRRFAAALFLGVTGYAMAGLFVVSGAPDLALTQVAIETLTTVLFVLVLRRLPGDFTTRAPAFRRALRALVAGSVAAVVFAFGIIAAGSRKVDPISDDMVARALPDGNGKNVVNVILVDFRALDTMGEVTVLAVAAIGAVALARAGRRPSKVDS